MQASAHGEKVISTLRQPSVGGRPDYVRESWRRCLQDFGLEPERPRAVDLLTRSELAEVTSPVEDLVSLARSEVDRLFARLNPHGYFVTLNEKTGVTLLLRCSPELVEGCRKAGLMVGSIWSEDLRGTNGIGTALAARCPVSIVRDDHFTVDFTQLTCNAAPIHGERGSIAGVLNVTTPHEADHTSQRFVRDILSRAAQRIERMYFARRFAGGTVVRLSRYDDFADIAEEHWLALDSGERIVDATPSAEKALRLPLDRLIGSKLGEVIDLRKPQGNGETQAAVTRSGTQLFLRGLESGRRQAPAPQRPAAPSARTPAPAEFSLTELVGYDPVMTERLRITKRLVDRRLPILLQGETGTGKTTVARTLHRESAHGDGPFVAFNCAAIPGELIESELFGYRPGAFTGASREGSPGRLVEANGGTLFLDEIGDMPLHLQTRLLHVLSEGEFVPVGGTKPIRVDFSVISASLHDIQALVKQGRFREDLYFRLSGAVIPLPALRDRIDRMEIVAAAFAREAEAQGRGKVRLTPDVSLLLKQYPWPGNMRELAHVARYALAVSEGEIIQMADLPATLGAPAQQEGEGPALLAKAETERRVLTLTLDQTDWNVSRAAQRLGMSRATLHRKINVYGLRRM
jgi:transcriptional regulator of acetoin/glycerol metabolism